MYPIGIGNVKYLQIMFWSKHLSTLNKLIGMYRFVLFNIVTLVSLQNPRIYLSPFTKDIRGEEQLTSL